MRILPLKVLVLQMVPKAQNGCFTENICKDFHYIYATCGNLSPDLNFSGATVRIGKAWSLPKVFLDTLPSNVF